MARPKKRSIDVATPERILRAAEQVFALHGPVGARLADIALLAGITRPSLLHHFPSKEALYEACVHGAFAELGTVLGHAMQAEGAFVTRLEQVVRSFVSFAEARPHIARLILREVLGDDGPGRALLLEHADPLISGVEAFLLEAGAGQLRPGLPVRAAMLQFVADVLVRAGAGDLRIPLWGLGEHAWTLVHTMFLQEQYK